MKIPDDPYIIELLPEFVDSWIEDVNSLLPPIVASKNCDELLRFAHTIKGSCYQFGFDNIAEMGILLMGYAKDNDWENAVKLCESIKNSFIDVKSQLLELGFKFEQK